MSDITTSTTVKELATALAKAQAKMKAAVKDSTNPFYKSKYADLTSVWEACREALTANGLSVTQFPGFEPGEPWAATVTTVLLHTSGEWIKGTAGAPLKTADAQGVGSAITYLRRYALAAVTGVVQEDDDGEASTKPKNAPTEPRRVHPEPPARKAGPPDYPGPITLLPFGKKKGTPLVDLETEELTSVRAWCFKQDPTKFADLIEKVDEVLAGRGGE